MNINEIVLSDEIMVRFQKILSNPLTHKSLLKSYSVKLCAYFVVLCVTNRLYHYSNIPLLQFSKIPTLHYSNFYGLNNAKY
jgi:hypothetical protein